MLWAEAEGLGELQCCLSLKTRKKLAPPGPRCPYISTLKIPWERNHRRPAKQHLLLPSLPSAKTSQRRKIPAPEQVWPALSHFCAPSSLTQTQAGFCLSLPDFVSTIRHLWPLPRGSSSPLPLPSSKPLQQGNLLLHGLVLGGKELLMHKASCRLWKS